MLKQISSLLAVLLINVLTIHGQDYQTVRSGRIAYFNNEAGNIRCIKIDSVVFQTDSVLFPMPNIQQLDYNCFTPKGNSWIGKKVVIQGNGVNLFFNNYNDTIRIKTNARVHESWTAFELKDSLKVIAEIKSKDTLTILGELDSVKTIQFQLFDRKMEPISHFLNEKPLLLSKNHGFVRMMNFNLFPNKPTYFFYEELETLSLIGLTNPDRGVQNLTSMEVFDFQVGDELHILFEYRNWDGFGGTGNLTTRKTILKYLERLNTKDSVTYKIDREESTFRRIQKWDSTTYVIVHDTIKAVYRPDSLFDKLPGEPIVSDYRGFANRMTNGDHLSKTNPSAYEVIWPSNDSCWNKPIAEGCAFDYSFIKGLGGPYYGCLDVTFGEESKLVYYKKGSTTWGTPLIITDVKNFENEDQIKVYPNPTADFVIIENTSGRTEKYGLHLMDLQGREVFRNSIELTNSYRLDISSLREGAYLLKLQNGEKQISRMIVKKP